MSEQTEQIRTAVQQRYGAIARGEASGCGPAGKSEVAIGLGYSSEDLKIAGNANLGVGCGNPLALAEMKPGMTVLDLGSGAGFDAMLAWRQLGGTGRVIGVDMTDDMLAQARRNAALLEANNVEFRKGFIEQLPVEDASVDFILSNCVINLSADKPAVFREMARVLKPGGRFAVSDIVLLHSLPEAVEKDVNAYVGCIAGASLLSDYVAAALEAGLDGLSIPQIVAGENLLQLLGGVPSSDESGCCGEGAACCGADLAAETAQAIASIKLHGGKRP